MWPFYLQLIEHMEESQKWHLNAKDFLKWIENSTVFLAPVIVLYLVSVQKAINMDGFQWGDFQITPSVFGAMTLYYINVALDFLKKLMAGER